MTLEELAATLLAGRGFAHKRDIGDVLGALARALPGGEADLAQAVAVGDDCAAIRDQVGDGDDSNAGHLLFAIEGFVDDFVRRVPWFAGYCGVMVNASDVYAMGGRPIAVVDALWSDGLAGADELLAGLAAASQRYGVPIVGGHTNARSGRGALAVAIVGRAGPRLLTSFDAVPGDTLLMAIDLRGAYHEPDAYWDASTSAPAERLRADLELLPALAEDGLCRAAKDISMAGAVGTALMLLECSRVGAVVDVDAIPRPDGVPADGADFARWLQAFPSYGFVLSVRPDRAREVADRFQGRGIACASVGVVTAAPQVMLRRRGERALLWDVSARTLIRARQAAAAREPAGA